MEEYMERNLRICSLLDYSPMTSLHCATLHPSRKDFITLINPDGVLRVVDSKNEQCATYYLHFGEYYGAGVVQVKSKRAFLLFKWIPNTDMEFVFTTNNSSSLFHSCLPGSRCALASESSPGHEGSFFGCKVERIAVSFTIPRMPSTLPINQYKITALHVSTSGSLIAVGTNAGDIGLSLSCQLTTETLIQTSDATNKQLVSAINVIDIIDVQLDERWEIVVSSSLLLFSFVVARTAAPESRSWKFDLFTLSLSPPSSFFFPSSCIVKQISHIKSFLFVACDDSIIYVWNKHTTDNDWTLVSVSQELSSSSTVCLDIASLNRSILIVLGDVNGRVHLGQFLFVKEDGHGDVVIMGSLQTRSGCLCCQFDKSNDDDDDVNGLYVCERKADDGKICKRWSVGELTKLCGLNDAKKSKMTKINNDDDDDVVGLTNISGLIELDLDNDAELVEDDVDEILLPDDLPTPSVLKLLKERQEGKMTMLAGSSDKRRRHVDDGMVVLETSQAFTDSSHDDDKANDDDDDDSYAIDILASSTLEHPSMNSTNKLLDLKRRSREDMFQQSLLHISDDDDEQQEMTQNVSTSEASESIIFVVNKKESPSSVDSQYLERRQRCKPPKWALEFKSYQIKSKRCLL